MVATTDPERRAQLVGVALRALVSDHLGRPVDATPTPLLGGAALVDDGIAWVLIDGDASRLLGASLAWSIRHDATALHLIAELGGATIARRAQQFSYPISVWYPEERTLLPTVPEPLPEHTAVPPGNDDLRAMIADAGAVVNVEHGVVTGEVRGLEVCRIVDQPTVGFFAELSDVVMPADVEGAADRPDGVRLEVGVGAADREAFQMLHGDVPTADALASVVETVIAHRTTDARQHPLNRLGVERYLRWSAAENPASVGMQHVTPAEPPMPRPNLKDAIPCVAHAVAPDGTAATIVFSAGVDLDLIAFVADVQHTTDDPVHVAVPERDLVSVTREMAALLREPITLVALA